MPVKLPIALQANEKVILRCRRHPVFLFYRMARVLLIGLIPVIVLQVAILDAGDTLRTIGHVLSLVWGLSWLIIAYFTWYRYNRDEWIITNQRLIDSVRKHWFNHEISSADLVNVEDMKVSQNGILQTVFRFGSLICQTAGTQQNFRLEGIPRPSEVLATLDQQRDAARRELYGSDERARAAQRMH